MPELKMNNKHLSEIIKLSHIRLTPKKRPAYIGFISMEYTGVVFVLITENTKKAVARGRVVGVY
ncbi:hypothetical protein [Marinococcus luteus]|uniref:hypothetical protein n=1 Tax=Marinococcus luteus TaxID=1122204 RepID=UPI002ACD1D87|nr:hypothetical protein [Marinococcus luteus]MDZ5781938.1 hypothetical protein [Marinococcus luteus]